MKAQERYIFIEKHDFSPCAKTYVQLESEPHPTPRSTHGRKPFDSTAGSGGGVEGRRYIFFILRVQCPDQFPFNPPSKLRPTPHSIPRSAPVPFPFISDGELCYDGEEDSVSAYDSDEEGSFAEAVALEALKREIRSQSSENCNILVVCHAGTIKALVPSLKGTGYVRNASVVECELGSDGELHGKGVYPAPEPEGHLQRKQGIAIVPLDLLKGCDRSSIDQKILDRLRTSMSNSVLCRHHHHSATRAVVVVSSS